MVQSTDPSSSILLVNHTGSTVNWYHFALQSTAVYNQNLKANLGHWTLHCCIWPCGSLVIQGHTFGTQHATVGKIRLEKRSVFVARQPWLSLWVSHDQTFILWIIACLKSLFICLSFNCQPSNHIDLLTWTPCGTERAYHNSSKK